MQITFVLVEPAVPANVGAAARAIKTMGFRSLHLVNPCNHLSEEAIMLAHGSFDVLSQAGIFHSLTDAVSGVDLVIGTTAKKRRYRFDYHPAGQLPTILNGKGNAIQKVALVFGREESGLHGEELEACHLLSTIPLADSYPSLNLSQAVMLYAYVLSPFAIARIQPEPQPRNEEGFRALLQKSESVLNDLGFNPGSTLYQRIMDRLILLGEDDIHLLHSICSAYLEKFKIY